jgi:peptidyl-prolyl cis-trans isomerase A (cyclophilin A)
VEIEEMEKENKAPRDLQAPPASAKTTATGLKYRLLNTGKSKSKLVDKEDGESVSMTYKVWTKNGTLVDHGSLGEIAYGREANQGAPFALVIRGLAEGLALMKPLQEFRLWIPAHLAHGDSPRVPNVPAGPLVVDVKLLAR